MHFEILVEDISGKKCLDTLVPMIKDQDDTFRVISYKGIGRIPKSMTLASDPQKRILLDNLPRLLQGYGRAFSGYSAIVVVVCDLDRRDLDGFSSELAALLDDCNPRPETRFCLAIEEGEAWYLGDIPAIKTAFPKAKDAVLSGYVNDSICGTWETLADAIYPGGARALSGLGWQKIGAEKFRWATEITQYMNVNMNMSASFCRFRDCLRTAG